MSPRKGRRKHKIKKQKPAAIKRKIDFSKPYIFLPGLKENPKVEWKDIVWLEADDNYTDVHLVKHIVNTITVTLGKVQTSLPPSLFFRIHESFLVNIDHIRKILKNKQIEMDDGKVLSVSKPHWKQLLSILPFIS